MIVSIKGGPLALSTTVTNADGTPIPSLTKIEFQPIVPDGKITVILSVAMALIDIEATAFLSVENLEEAAAFHGYRLVPIAEDSNGATDAEARA